MGDGRVQTVTYHDGGDGMVQEVTYTGEAVYDEAPVYKAPVVHHAAPVVHHAAPVVHHAAPVVHSHQVHGGSHHGALHQIRAPVVVAPVAPVRHVAHVAPVHHAPASHNVVHQVLSPFHNLMSIVRNMIPF